MGWMFVPGKLTRGYQVASGPSKNYPYGTVERQKPLFKLLGLDLTDCFNGTLNIDISPVTFGMLKPQYTFPLVNWTDLHPPETFSFSACRVVYKDVEYSGWVYYPHPETKLQHFQSPSLLEVVAKPIPGIQYDDNLGVWVNPDEIRIIHQAQ